jgi:energy-coupling factor transporter ATP-binding protein EcfA2
MQPHTAVNKHDGTNQLKFNQSNQSKTISSKRGKTTSPIKEIIPGCMIPLSVLKLSDTRGTFTGYKYDLVKVGVYRSISKTGRQAYRERVCEMSEAHKALLLQLPDLSSSSISISHASNVVYYSDFFPYREEIIGEYTKPLPTTPRRKVVKPSVQLAAERKYRVSVDFAVPLRAEKTLPRLVKKIRRMMSKGRLHALSRLVDLNDGSYWMNAFPRCEKATVFEFLMYPSAVNQLYTEMNAPFQSKGVDPTRPQDPPVKSGEGGARRRRSPAPCSGAVPPPPKLERQVAGEHIQASENASVGSTKPLLNTVDEFNAYLRGAAPSREEVDDFIMLLQGVAPSRIEAGAYRGKIFLPTEAWIMSITEPGGFLEIMTNIVALSTDISPNTSTWNLVIFQTIKAIFFKLRLHKDALPLAGIQAIISQYTSLIGMPEPANSSHIPNSSREWIWQGITDDVKSSIGLLRHSPLSKKVIALISATVSSAIFGENTLLHSDFIKVVWGRLCSATNALLDPIEIVTDLMSFLFERIKKYQQTGVIADLFGLPKETQALYDTEEVMREMQQLRRGEEIMSGMTPHELISKSERVQLKYLLLKVPLVSSKLVELNEATNHFRDSINFTRLAPLGLILTGPSGTGKTHMLQMVAECLSHKHELDPEIPISYTWLEEKFQKLPAVVKMIVLNDYFSTKAEYCETDPLSLIQRMIDTAPLSAEGASLSEKRNSYIQPDIVGISTNASTYTLSTASSGANKLDRRVTIIASDFTEVCRVDAAAVGMTPADFYKVNAMSRNDLVSYTIGKMCNTDGTELVLKPVGKTLVYTNPNDVLAWIMQMENARGKVVRPHVEFCEGCRMPKSDICLCKTLSAPSVSSAGCVPVSSKLKARSLRVTSGVPTLSFSLPNLAPVEAPTSYEEERFVSPLTDSDQDLMRFERDFESVSEEEELELQGQSVSVTHRVDRDITDLLASFRDDFSSLAAHSRLTFQEAMNLISNKVVPETAALRETLETAHYKLGVSLFIAVTGASVTVLAMLAMLRKLIPQGLVASTPSVKEEHAYVKPTVTGDAPWMGSFSGDPTFEVGYARGHLAMHGIFVTQKMVQIPLHFFYTGNTCNIVDQRFYIRNNGIEYPIQFSEEFLVRGKSTEECYYYVHASVGNMSACYSKMFKKSTAPSTTCRLGAKYPYMAVDSALQYDPVTVGGDCGLPLMDREGSVYGIHVALIKRNFGGNRSVSIPVCKESCDIAIAEFKRREIHIDHYGNSAPRDITFQSLKPGLHPQSDAWHCAQTENMNPLLSGHVPIGHFASMDRVTMSVRPTKLHDTFGPKCKHSYAAPWTGHARLQPDGTYSSQVTKRFLSGQLYVSYDHNVMLKAMDDYIDGLPPASGIVPLTTYDAICGSAMNGMINGTDIDKSIGVTLRSLGLNKNQVFKPGAKEGDYIIHPEALKLLAEAEAEVRGGLLNPIVVKGTPKDEPLAQSKVDQGMNRNFYVADRHINWLGRKFILPILSYLAEHPLDSHCVVTMNAGCSDFKKLGEYLCQFGIDNIYDEDQAAFDMNHGWIAAYVGLCMKKIALKIGYTEEDGEIVRRIVAKNGRSFLISEGNVFLVDRCLWSGLSYTIFFNCLVVVLNHAYLSRKMAKENYRRIMTLAATGDDAAVGCNDNRINGIVIAEEFTKLGYVTTAGDKSAIITKKNLHEISYLKRVWTSDMKGALAPESIYRSLAYVSGVSSADEEKRNRATAMSALREWFLHGEEVYNREADIIVGVVDIPRPTYEELQVEYDTNEFKTWVVMESKPHTKYSPPGCFGIVETPLISYDHSLSDADKEKLRDYDLVLQGQASPNDDSKMVAESVKPNYHTDTTTTTTQLSLNTTETYSPSVEHDLTMNFAVTEDEVLVESKATSIFPRCSTKYADLANFLARPRLTWRKPINGNAETEIFGRWASIPEVAPVLSNYTLFRGGPTVKFVYTGSSQLLGLYRVYFWPKAAMRSGIYNPGPFDAYDLAPQSINHNFAFSHQLPHLDFDLSESVTKEIQLPFPYYENYMKMTDDDWIMYGTPINMPLMAAGTTPPVLYIDVYVSYKDIELAVIVPQGLEAPKNVLSNGLNYASLLAARLPVYWSPWLAAGLSMAGNLAKFMGYSRPLVEPQDAMVARTGTTLGVASGAPSFSMPLALDPSVTRNADSKLLPMFNEDDTKPLSIARKWGMIAKGITLPYDSEADPMAVESISNRILTTPLWFVSSVFEYWTGDLEICMEVMSSPLIRWRLGIMIIPPGQPVPGTFDDQGGYLTEVVEVIGSTCHEFTIPYLHRNNFRDVTLLGPGDGTFFAIYALTDALGPSVTPVLPYINLYMRAGPSYSLGLPSLANVDGLYPGETVELQGLGVPSEATFGEVVDDITLLTRRPTVGALFSANHSQWIFPVNPYAVAQFDSLPSGFTSYENHWTYLSYLSLPYFGVMGGVEVKVVTGDDTLVAMVGNSRQVIECTASTAGPINPSRGVALFRNTQNSLIEVSVPDRNPSQFRRPINYQFTASQEAVTIYRYSTITNPVEGALLYSGKDDLRFSGWLASPSLSI